ncbi:hypothetical protein KQI74_23290 [Paenibacillus barcinonensis]|nr:hypothetical protein [Paenibacillus barcinonensis]MBU5355186.1 hypothetical protein [Paenibacillus barcinonensis]
MKTATAKKSLSVFFLQYLLLQLQELFMLHQQAIMPRFQYGGILNLGS